MKVSVIIPAWGRTPYLSEARDSLAEQTFRDVEIVECKPPPGGHRHPQATHGRRAARNPAPAARSSLLWADTT